MNHADYQPSELDPSRRSLEFRFIVELFRRLILRITLTACSQGEGPEASSVIAGPQPQPRAAQKKSS